MYQPSTTPSVPGVSKSIWQNGAGAGVEEHIVEDKHGQTERQLDEERHVEEYHITQQHAQATHHCVLEG